ncbi:dead box ATP-dependent rna helicase [Pseudozyma hubeiensis SY62]|uniref:Dead box ATP-dependent rna helicase n=1 Tax=Pseudozyma hubeiensis (strain SY62) TaxID=1305764 RepID=R9P5A1_PSEHS|nr:dead box ATP-dependent rna helicase [Pseudozyma hubeiensis SY62]GAC96541.1 dead box ATP-dependent rna helicase [Pseudozyma hubeiensis SY62]
MSSPDDLDPGVVTMPVDSTAKLLAGEAGQDIKSASSTVYTVCRHTIALLPHFDPSTPPTLTNALSIKSTNHVRPRRYSVSPSPGTRERSHGSGKHRTPPRRLQCTADKSTADSLTVFLVFLLRRLQSAPGKDSHAVPDDQQRGGVFGDGENKGAESGQAGDSNSGAGNLKNVSIMAQLFIAFRSESDQSKRDRLADLSASFSKISQNRRWTMQSTPQANTASEDGTATFEFAPAYEAAKRSQAQNSWLEFML